MPNEFCPEVSKYVRYALRRLGRFRSSLCYSRLKGIVGLPAREFSTTRVRGLGLRVVCVFDVPRSSEGRVYPAALLGDLLAVSGVESGRVIRSHIIKLVIK